MTGIPSKIRISGAPYAEDFTFEIDGQDVTHGMTSADLHLDADSVPTLTIGVVAQEIEVDGEAEVVMLEATRELLMRFGWTPPDDGAPEA